MNPFLLVFLLFFSLPSFAKLNVVTTLTDLKVIVEEVGKEAVSVESIAKGTQDPHAIEAKPSFMVKLSRADLLISIGLELEKAWLDSIIRGARNPRLITSGKGHLEVGELVSPLEVAHGSVTRADGDVHPAGNPHVTLDPVRMGEIAIHIGNRLAELDSEHSSQYKTNAASLQKRLLEKTKTWSSRIEKSGVKKVVTYHKTLTYFLDKFKIQNVAILEPKPGIPPTSGHILEVIQKIKSEKVPLILVENYFDPTVTKRVKDEVRGLRAEVVPVSVEGTSDVKTIDDLYETLVKTIEGK